MPLKVQLEYWLGCFVIYLFIYLLIYLFIFIYFIYLFFFFFFGGGGGGVLTSIAKEPYIFVIFQEMGGSGPLPPSGSVHVYIMSCQSLKKLVKCIWGSTATLIKDINDWAVLNIVVFLL